MPTFCIGAPGSKSQALYASAPVSCWCIWQTADELKYLSSSHPCGRPGLSSRFLISGWPSPDCCWHLESELVIEDFFLFSPLCYKAIKQILKYSNTKDIFTQSWSWYTRKLTVYFSETSQSLKKENKIQVLKCVIHTMSNSQSKIITHMKKQDKSQSIETVINYKDDAIRFKPYKDFKLLLIGPSTKEHNN